MKQISTGLIKALRDIRDSGQFNMVMDASSVVNELINKELYFEASELMQDNSGRVDFKLYMEALDKIDEMAIAN
ncbi:hypothetical protein D3C81_333540 [compost metagenome]